MRPKFYAMLLAFLVFSCASLQNMGNSNDRVIPSIGTIGKEENSILTKNFELIGIPHLEKGLPLSVREIQFDKSKFKAYSDFKSRQGKQPTVMFVDSLPIKPKYLCLEIADKIALQSQLNSDNNIEVRTYLGSADFQSISIQHTGIQVNTSKKHSIFLVRLQGFP